MVEKREFRSDLYYRLNVFPIKVPPLRERVEDIPPLVWHFVREFSGRHGRAIESIPSHTMKALTSYHWPGNIRELQNVIERSVIISKCPVLTVDFGELNFGNGNKCGEQNQGGLDDMLHEAERTEILRALELTDGVISGPHGAAVRLGIKRSTLLSRMQKLGINMSRNYVTVPQKERTHGEDHCDHVYIAEPACSLEKRLSDRPQGRVFPVSRPRRTQCLENGRRSPELP